MPLAEELARTLDETRLRLAESERLRVRQLAEADQKLAEIDRKLAEEERLRLALEEVNA